VPRRAREKGVAVSGGYLLARKRKTFPVIEGKKGMGRDKSFYDANASFRANGGKGSLSTKEGKKGV